MKKRGYGVYIAAIIAMLVISGCVAPPIEPSGNITNATNKSALNPTSTSRLVYVTAVTPYVTVSDNGVSETQTPGYHVFTTPTPLPEDKSCRIYITTQKFTYTGSAFTFNLKNPPMYINYTAKPTNLTGTRYYTSTYKSKPEVKETYSIYDPQSFLEITVRNKTSGEIYLQDGFGIGYTAYLTRTLKVLDQDDLLIELKGNKITATVSVWVKPEGNFDNPDNMTFDACTYWGQSTRDTTALAYPPKTTATPAYRVVPTATPRRVAVETVTTYPTYDKWVITNTS